MKKKLIAIAMGALFSLSLFGCAGSNQEPVETRTPNSSSSNEIVLGANSSSDASNGGTGSAGDSSSTGDAGNNANTSSNTENSTSSSTSSNTTTQQTTISEAEAEEIALAHAGQTRENLIAINTHIDQERGMQVFEINFFTADTEYEYDVSTVDGSIVEWDAESRKG